MRLFCFAFEDALVRDAFQSNQRTNTVKIQKSANLLHFFHFILAFFCFSCLIFESLYFYIVSTNLYPRFRHQNMTFFGTRFRPAILLFRRLNFKIPKQEKILRETTSFSLFSLVICDLKLFSYLVADLLNFYSKFAL